MTTHHLSRRVSRAWRIVRSAGGFAVVGACGLALAAWLPVVRRLESDPQTADLRAQRIVHRTCRFYIWLMERFGLMQVRGVGIERLSQGGPHLVVANHPTLADVVILLAHMPQLDCIVGAEYANHPILWGAASTTGYIRNDGGVQVVEESVRRLRAGRSLLVFPEGTRSPRGGLQPFHRGAAHVALRAAWDLLPVVIDCQPPTLMKGQPWYEVPERTIRVTLRVEEPISAKPYADSGRSAPIAARKLTAELREWFAKSMALHQGSSKGNPR